MTWRIPATIEVQHRLKIDGGKPLFAWLDFILQPSDQPDDLVVTTAWEDETDCIWFPAIRAAVAVFVDARKQAGQPVGYTTIVMTRVISHPVDTDDYAVQYNLTRALESHFGQHAVNDAR